jgi:hypothetical protein
MFYEAWLNTQILRSDYELAELGKQSRELTRTLDSLKAESARLEAVDQVNVKAMDLGLVAPRHEQIEVLSFPQQTLARNVSNNPGAPMNMARVSPVSRVREFLFGDFSAPRAEQSSETRTDQ